MTMKKFSLLAWLLTFVLAACQIGSKPESKIITDEDIARSVQVTHVAEIEVEGMTCEMGCGGDIRKALRGTGGVAKVDFDFEENREVNIARVQYDSETVATVDLKKIILSLNKGQFKVGHIETKDFANSDSSTENSGGNESASPVQMKNNMLSLTDLVGIVASWFL